MSPWGGDERRVSKSAPDVRVSQPRPAGRLVARRYWKVSRAWSIWRTESGDIRPLSAARKRSAASLTFVLVPCERHEDVEGSLGGNAVGGHQHTLACSIRARDLATFEMAVVTSNCSVSVMSK
jgi:hypothetical protein